MCIFTGDVRQVSSTRIFAREAGGGRQFLVYGMRYEAASDLAMVLPLPVARGSGEDAVQFIDLSGYPSFFEDLEAGFFRDTRGWRGGTRSAEPTKGILPVVRVGSFDASFVPTLADFSRLDPRFRLPEQVWDYLPQYQSWGFAVFKLRRGAVQVHPMAFSFPKMPGAWLFFPTVHVHDGQVHRMAVFDHSLYCQLPAGSSSLDTAGWHESDVPAAEFMQVSKARGLVDGAQACYRKVMQGTLPNTDVVAQAR